MHMKLCNLFAQTVQGRRFERIMDIFSISKKSASLKLSQAKMSTNAVMRKESKNSWLQGCQSMLRYIASLRENIDA